MIKEIKIGDIVRNINPYPYEPAFMVKENINKSFVTLAYLDGGGCTISIHKENLKFYKKVFSFGLLEKIRAYFCKRNRRLNDN